MNALIFGYTGSIGNYIFNKFEKEQINVIGTSTNINNHSIHNKIIYVDKDNLHNLLLIDKLHIVIWAIGSNYNDNIETYSNVIFNKLLESNIIFIIETLSFLLKNNKIHIGSKMVIISSIYEDITRENKLSYTITKSALKGLLKNVSIDLSSKNILINNVLPGVIDNEMSRETLSIESFKYIENYTGFKRLINLDDVYSLIKYLVINNTAITGQSIKVDLGFTNITKMT